MCEGKRPGGKSVYEGWTEFAGLNIAEKLYRAKCQGLTSGALTGTVLQRKEHGKVD